MGFFKRKMIRVKIFIVHKYIYYAVLPENPEFRENSLYSSIAWRIDKYYLHVRISRYHDSKKMGIFLTKVKFFKFLSSLGDRDRIGLSIRNKNTQIKVIYFFVMTSMVSTLFTPLRRIEGNCILYTQSSTYLYRLYRIYMSFFVNGLPKDPTLAFRIFTYLF
jgi:hypothetical protein